MKPDKPIIVSMGEPSGISSEIIIKAWLKRDLHKIPPFILVDDLKKLNQDVIISNSKICIHKYNLIFKKKSEKISFGLVCENNLNYVYVDAPIESTNLFIKIIEPILANQEFPGVPKNE